MNKQYYLITGLQITLVTILLLVGCTTEDPVTPPPATGTLIINPSP